MILNLIPIILVAHLSYLSLDHWAYDELEKFHTAGYLTEEHFNSKPFTRTEVAKMVTKLNTADLANRPALKWSLDRLNTEFYQELQSDSSQVFINTGIEIHNNTYTDINNDDKLTNRLRGDIFASFSYKNRIGFYEDFFLDENRAHDPNYIGQVWEARSINLAGGFIGYLLFEAKPFEISFGRNERFWGPAHYGSLILSNNSQQFDMLGMSMKWRWLNVETVNAKLDSYKGENRYFAGHRFAFKFFKGVEFAFTETVIYSGQDRNFELYYINPFMFYHIAQENRSGPGGYDDNTFGSIDASITLLPGYKFYGVAFVDDYQIEEAGKDKEPNEIGFTIGIYTVETIPYLVWRIEYTQIKKWTYNHRFPQNRYIHLNKPIAHWLGQDGDNLHLYAEYDLTPEFRLYADYDLTRQGEGSLFDEWTLNQEKYEPEPFPSGIVERINQLELALEYNRFTNPKQKTDLDLTARLSGMYENIKNKGNIDAENNDGFAFSLSLRAKFDWNGRF